MHVPGAVRSHSVVVLCQVLRAVASVAVLFPLVLCPILCSVASVRLAVLLHVVALLSAWLSCCASVLCACQCALCLTSACSPGSGAEHAVRAVLYPILWHSRCVSVNLYLLCTADRSEFADSAVVLTAAVAPARAGWRLQRSHVRVHMGLSRLLRRNLCIPISSFFPESLRHTCRIEVLLHLSSS